MVQWVTIADAAYAFVASGLFAYVGRASVRPGAHGMDLVALSMFRAWWFGVATFLFLGAALTVLEWQGLRDGPAGFVVAVMSMLSVCVAVWGLVFYVMYLYTGGSRILVPGLVFYALVFAGMVYALLLDSSGHELAAWHQSVVRLAILTGPLLSWVIVAFLVPAVAALVAYAGLYRRVETRAQRFRLGLSTGSLIVWFGLAITAWGVGVADTEGWLYAGRFLALAAAGGVLLAYSPPRWVARQLRLLPEDAA